MAKMLQSLFLTFACLTIAGATLQGEKGTTTSRRTGSAAGVEILTATNGVDFTAYTKELYASVRKNWFAIMPESIETGQKGKVIVRFRILPDGKLQEKEPTVESASGSEEFRRASIAAITDSSPFKPLPEAFAGPYIDVRFIFLYNLPIAAAKP